MIPGGERPGPLTDMSVPCLKISWAVLSHLQANNTCSCSGKRLADKQDFVPFAKLEMGLDSACGVYISVNGDLLPGPLSFDNTIFTRKGASGTIEMISWNPFQGVSSNL